jgi:hypothetical protein
MLAFLAHNAPCSHENVVAIAQLGRANRPALKIADAQRIALN